MPNPLNIGVIGSGTFGTGLALGLASMGYQVVNVSSRTGYSARALASVIPGCHFELRPQQVADQCDLVFITTPDDVIEEIANETQWNPDQGVVHCSGTGSLQLLQSAADSGAHCGAFHPFQTFAGVRTGSEALNRFKGVTFALEGSGWILPILKTIVSDLGGRYVNVEASERPLYHVSAVMSCGYLAVLLEAAAEIWEDIGFPKGDGIAAILPMATATIENFGALGIASAMTGPVKRGDVGTVKKHLQILQRRAPHLLALYIELCRYSLSWSDRGNNDGKVKDMELTLQNYMKENL